MTRQQRILLWLATPTAKLAATYLAIIMLMSVSFSIILYQVSVRPFDRPAPRSSQFMPLPRDRMVFNSQIQQELEVRFGEARRALMIQLIWVNIGALFVGAGISYALARRSLRPIEEAMEAQTQFISDASHELRTPLTVLQTTNEVALRKSKLSIRDTKNLISHNIAETQKLRDLSNALLELLKDDSRPISLSSVDIQATTSDALQSIVTIAQAKNITVDNEVKRLRIRSNELLLEQLLGILLANAVKYSRPTTTITLVSKKVADKVHLSVIDEGIGIHPSDMPYIFQRFYRADKSRTGGESSGYGLGLSIAEKIARRIHANISVVSTPDEGSTFTLELPE